MILNAFGPDAATLLLSGASGGLVRGLVVLRSKLLAAGGVTSAALASLGIDVSTSIVIGALFAEFGSQLTIAVVNPMIGWTGNQIDWNTRVGTAGFTSGLVGIAIATMMMDIASKVDLLKLFKPKETP